MDSFFLDSSGDFDPSRISRACDPCHSMKSKCPGGYPCPACSKRGIDCTYSEPKKRGPKPGARGPLDAAHVESSTATKAKVDKPSRIHVPGTGRPSSFSSRASPPETLPLPQPSRPSQPLTQSPALHRPDPDPAHVLWIRLYFLFANPVLPMVCKTQFYYALMRLGVHDVVASLCEDTRPVCAPHAAVAAGAASSSRGGAGLGSDRAEAGEGEQAEGGERIYGGVSAGIGGGAVLEAAARTTATARGLLAAPADVHDDDSGHRDCDCAAMTFAPLRRKDGSLWRMRDVDGNTNSDNSEFLGDGGEGQGQGKTGGSGQADSYAGSTSSSTPIPFAFSVRIASSLGPGGGPTGLGTPVYDGSGNGPAGSGTGGRTEGEAQAARSGRSVGEEAIALWQEQVHKQQLRAVAAAMVGHSGEGEGGHTGGGGSALRGAFTLPSMLPPATNTVIRASPELTAAHTAQLPACQRAPSASNPVRMAASRALYNSVLAIGARMDGELRAADAHAASARHYLSAAYDEPACLDALSASMCVAYYHIGTAGDGDTRRAKIHVAVANEAADSMEQALKAVRERSKEKSNVFSGHSLDPAGGPPPLPHSHASTFASVTSEGAGTDPAVTVLPLDLLLTVRFLAQITSAHRAGNASMAALVRQLNPHPASGLAKPGSAANMEGSGVAQPTPPSSSPTYSAASSARDEKEKDRGGLSLVGGGMGQEPLRMGDEWSTPRGRISRILAFVTAITRRTVSTPEQLSHRSVYLLSLLDEADAIDRDHAPGGPMGYTLKMTINLQRAVVRHAAQDTAGARVAAEAALASLNPQPVLRLLTPFVTAAMLVQLVPVLLAVGLPNRAMDVLRYLAEMGQYWPIAGVLLAKAQRRIAYHAGSASVPALPSLPPLPTLYSSSHSWAGAGAGGGVAPKRRRTGTTAGGGNAADFKPAAALPLALAPLQMSIGKGGMGGSMPFLSRNRTSATVQGYATDGTDPSPQAQAHGFSYVSMDTDLPEAPAPISAHAHGALQLHGGKWVSAPSTGRGSASPVGLGLIMAHGPGPISGSDGSPSWASARGQHVHVSSRVDGGSTRGPDPSPIPRGIPGSASAVSFGSTEGEEGQALQLTRGVHVPKVASAIAGQSVGGRIGHESTGAFTLGLGLPAGLGLGGLALGDFIDGNDMMGNALGMGQDMGLGLDFGMSMGSMMGMGQGSDLGL